jgi:DNA invertase Pin-like site-specific DNA recombinase
VRRRNLPRTFDELVGRRARGLVRESTERQGDNSGPIVQLREQREFAERWGLIFEHRPDPAGLPEPYTYTDLVSGSDAAKRPQFLQMVADAKAGAFDVLLVRETSRFARNWRQAGTYEDRLHEAGVVVAYIFEGRLSSDRAGQLQLVVNHSINEEFRLKLAENVQGGYRVKRFEAGKFSGTPPIGYVLEYVDVELPGKAKGHERRDTGRLLPDDEPRELVSSIGGTYTNAGLARLIGQLYATGRWGVRSLAAHLNGLGYRNRRGEPLSGHTIRHMVASPTYKGAIAWHWRRDKRELGEGDELVEGAHEALWSPQLWDQIQAVRGRQFRTGAGGRRRHIYPLRRIARCDRCNRRLVGEPHDGVPYMACMNRRETHDERCQGGVKTAVLESQVGAWLGQLRIPDDWRADIERLQRQLERRESTPQPDRRATLTGRLERLREFYFMGDIDRDEYTTRRHAIETELASGEGTVIAPLTTLSKAKMLLSDLAELWTQATAEERSDLASTLFDQVRVKDKVIVSAKLARPEYVQLAATSEARRLLEAGPEHVDDAPPERFELPTQALGRPRSIH